MPERCMPEVMSQADSFSQVLIKIQSTGNCAGNLRYLQGMCQPRTVVVTGRCNKNLRLVLQAAESFTVQNTVSVTLKFRTYRTTSFRSAPAF